jgi:hypothetical protein
MMGGVIVVASDIIDSMMGRLGSCALNSLSSEPGARAEPDPSRDLPAEEAGSDDIDAQGRKAPRGQIPWRRRMDRRYGLRPVTNPVDNGVIGHVPKLGAARRAGQSRRLESPPVRRRALRLSRSLESIMQRNEGQAMAARKPSRDRPMTVAEQQGEAQARNGVPQPARYRRRAQRSSPLSRHLPLSSIVWPIPLRHDAASRSSSSWRHSWAAKPDRLGKHTQRP